MSKLEEKGKGKPEEKEKKDGLVIFSVILGAIAITSTILAIVYVRLKACGVIEKEAPDEIIQISAYNTDAISIDENLTNVNDNPLADRQVYYAGFDDFAVKKGNIVFLENLKENDDIFMSYEIYIGDKLVHKTGLIPSGQYSEWLPADEITPGEYDIAIKNIPYYSYNGTDFFVLAYQPVNTVKMTILN